MGEDESPWRRHRDSWVPKLWLDPLEVAISARDGGGGGLLGEGRLRTRRRWRRGCGRSASGGGGAGGGDEGGVFV